MPINNSKYSEEISKRTAKHISKNGKSTTATAEEKGLKHLELKSNNELTKSQRTENGTESQREAATRRKNKIIDQKIMGFYLNGFLCMKDKL